ncbi:unnamed protein product [Boreogadus saida]
MTITFRIDEYLIVRKPRQLVIRRGLGRFQTVTSGHEAVGTLCKLFTGATPETDPGACLNAPRLANGGIYRYASPFFPTPIYPSPCSSSSYNPATCNISIQPSVNSSCNPTPNPTQPRTSNLNNCNPTPNPTQPKTSSSVNSSCNPTPNPTQPRTSRPKEEWLEHLIHHFNLSKKKQKKEAQQEGSLGELLKQMCKMNIEKDMEAIRQLKERAEENLDLMAMMSLMTHQQETFPQVAEPFCLFIMRFV